MNKSLKNQIKILTGVYLLTIVLWAIFVVVTKHTALYEGSLYHYILKPFLIGMIAVPLLGGIFGLQKAKSWGGWSSSMGRATMGLALGLIAWAGGMVIWNFYLFFLDVEVPYPSLADAIFILSWPLWSYGILNLSKATGAKFGLREKKGKLLLFIIPIVAILVSYYLLFVIARGGEFVWDVNGLQLFFDLFYPIGDIVILTAAALIFMLSRGFLGGRFRIPVLIILLGFLLNYASDFIFSYTTTIETYFNGHFVDFLFTTTMFVLAVGVNLLDPKLRNKNNTIEDKPED